jgi:FecR protein
MKRNFLAPVFSLGFLTVLSSAQVDISPGVARVSLIQGDVATQRGDTGDWAAAALNQPLVAGDKISTGDNSKAELQLDHANVLRLSDNSQAKIATLERVQNQRVQVQIWHGLAYYTVFKDSEAEVEIDTPNAAIRPTSKDGVYRIEVTGFETQVIVRAGAVDMATPQGSARVEMGQGATVRGTAQEAGNVLGGAPAMDRWDSWNIDRDELIRNAQSWNYTNRYYVGSEDLDAYGHWVSVPDYGRVWSPKVGGRWSPYRDGRWVWEPYWGWTWVSREPWGWTPYHYGRWFLYGKSWMWWPGRVDGERNYRPEWAPAYVSFFGFGGHRGAIVGFGTVGWLPLGPGDRFYPWYGQSGSQLKGVSVTDATNVTRLTRVIAPLRDDNEFSNVSLAAVDGRIRNAISALPADRFATGRSAPKTVDRRAFRDARIITGNLPIVPTREMLTATNRRANAPLMSSGGRQERYFTKRQPAAAPPSFDKEAAQVQESIVGSGQLVPVREVAQLDSADTAQPMALENDNERTVEPTKDAPGEHGSRSQKKVGLPAGSSSGMSRSTRAKMTPAPSYRGAKTRTAPRRGGNSHTAVSLRVPAATPTRRKTTLATGSRGSASRAAQSYIDSANRQMDKGNYTAAIASYKRALQVGGNTSAAKAYLGRAHRAMQAENEIIASRR